MGSCWIRSRARSCISLHCWRQRHMRLRRYVRGWRRERGRRAAADQQGSDSPSGQLGQGDVSDGPEPEECPASGRQEQLRGPSNGATAVAGGAKASGTPAAAVGSVAASAAARDAVGDSRGGLRRRRRQSAPAGLEPGPGPSPTSLSAATHAVAAPAAAATASGRRARAPSALLEAAALGAQAATADAAAPIPPSGEARPRRAASAKRPRGGSADEAGNAAARRTPAAPAVRERGPGTALLTLVLSTHNPTKIV